MLSLEVCARVSTVDGGNHYVNTKPQGQLLITRRLNGRNILVLIFIHPILSM